jgi:hypothetical protein
MPFLAPLALAGLLFIPVVIAMYLLKLRRDEAVVPSTLLWQKLVADVEANAPWQSFAGASCSCSSSSSSSSSPSWPPARSSGVPPASRATSCS